MQIIIPASGNVMNILGKPKTSDGACRLMCYVVSTPVNGGVLMFHTLTREMLLLTREEYEKRDTLPELREKWFVVPESLPDKAYADRARFILKATEKKPEHIVGYTIFTTTDCNARCFYCYEAGCSRIPMSEETARKAAEFIIRRSGGEKVTLSWFGGEPLYNQNAIDIICGELNERGVEYTSIMVTNGYLFDDETVKKAAELWKVRTVQITLDGTEEVYNRVKAYIYKDGKSPYRIVMGNIGKLLDRGIAVSVRMNIDGHNAENLMQLADELHTRCGSKEGLSAYSHTLFEFSGTGKRVRTVEERRQIYRQQQILQDRLKEYGFCRSHGVSRKFPLHVCMADSGRALTILPNGELGLCDDYLEDGFVGNLDSGELDAAVLKRFSETREPVEECAKCFEYPQCIRLKMCREEEECFSESRELRLRLLVDSMRADYAAWLKGQKPKETEKSDIC